MKFIMKDEPTVPSPVTPRLQRGLLVLTALLLLFQVGAVVNTFRLPPDLAAQVSLNPALQAVAGALWAVAAGVVMVRLLQRVPGAKQSALWLLVAFGVYTVVRLVLFTRADYDLGRLPFLLVVSALLICIPVVSIARAGRARFLNSHGANKHGCKPQNRTTTE
jgi:peptidoglycan/LPS O-acetylase OafA/YrhL